MTTIKEKAVNLLQSTEVVVLTSINPEGYPRPVPMAKIKSEGITDIWMATGKDAVKTKDFRKNPKAGVCFYTAGNSVALTGEIEIITEAGIKQDLWQEWFIEHFPKGPTDPDYVILKFHANQATLWIDGEFIHKKIRG